MVDPGFQNPFGSGRSLQDGQSGGKRAERQIDKRQGAKNVALYATDITPQSELDKLAPPAETIFLKRDRGSGRPTKKERREMDRLLDQLDNTPF